MKKYILIIITFIILHSFNTKAQMLGSLTLPGMGGGTNANAAAYPGDGVVVGGVFLFSSKLNAAVAAVAWNTGAEFLGGKYSLAVAQPRLMDGEFKNGFFPVTAMTPIQLSWDFNSFKLQGAYTFLYGQELPLNAHILTVKGTQYLADNKYSLNASAIYEYRSAKGNTERVFGDAFAIEANVSRHFSKGKSIGVFGYYNSNVTPEYIGGKEVFNENSDISGIGVDGNVILWEKLIVNGKFIYDLTANEAVKANKFVLSVYYQI